MRDQSKATTREVQTPLLDARPEAADLNLTQASHPAETAGVPRDHRQLEAFVAIRNFRTAIEKRLSAEVESLPLNAVGAAEQRLNVA